MRALKFAIFVAALPIAAVGLAFLVPLLRPIPTLAAGIYDSASNDDAAGEELERRLLQRFAVGTPALALTEHLKRENWGPAMVDHSSKTDPPRLFVQFKRPVNPFTVEVRTVVWQSDQDGRLVGVRGGYFRDAMFKQGGWS
jgi:hypothetical protein